MESYNPEPKEEFATKPKPSMDFMFEPYEPVLFWSQVPVNPKKVYVMLMYNVANGELKKRLHSLTHYQFVTYRCKLLKGFDEMEGVDTINNVFKMDFPYEAWQRAWRVGKDYRAIRKDEQVDCFVMLKKESIKSIQILKRKFIAFPEYDIQDAMEEFVGK